MSRIPRSFTTKEVIERRMQYSADEVAKIESQWHCKLDNVSRLVEITSLGNVTMRVRGRKDIKSKAMQSLLRMRAV